jgi:antitoxin (DNA-binding transcriptional repressor) of toxin-antitoxin stability system
VIRRAEAGERLRILVNRRAVAELGPIGRPQWISGAEVEAVLAESPADARLLADLAPIREQTQAPR